VGDVPLNRLDAEVELSGDAHVRTPHSHLLQNLALSR
jgi:hypothetical protein